MLSDFISILQWWVVFLVLGLSFLPLTIFIFQKNKDLSYIFSKVLGLGIVSYLILLLSGLHVLKFSAESLFVLIVISMLGNLIIWKKVLNKNKKEIKSLIEKSSLVMIFEEFLFLGGIMIWSYVRAHEPSIHGLEKFMDFGFVNSILRSEYLPPKDVWFTPLTINYYFFGHLSTAVLTKLSFVQPQIAYNIMIATIFSFTFVGGFSILYNLLSKLGKKKAFFGGILGGSLISLSGNLHTIYLLFKPYQAENPVPPWKLDFNPSGFPNEYWYPNATRFIPFTIHEFPIYSFVVSDLHGHVADIPNVLLSISLLLSVLLEKTFSKTKIAVFSFVLAIMYMTNVWDGIIYLLLGFLVILIINLPVKKWGTYLYEIFFTGGLVTLLYALFTLPFSIHFKPFVSGIGIVCSPKFLTTIGKIGPFLFEADHCQRSPIYQLLILYGFFLFFILCFIVFILRKLFIPNFKKKYLNYQNVFIFLLIILAVFLIAIPEFMYAKDIYPQHYRANTMFKLVYQSFVLLSICSTYIIVYLSSNIKNWILKTTFTIFTLVLLSFVFIYPYFAVRSYYTDLETYKGLDGLLYLKSLYPGDYEAIAFLNKNIQRQPVILEGQGDSYTDYARISSNTGLPTVLGWTVHEWLWRGTYDIPAPRVEEVKKMYEDTPEKTKALLQKYNVKYVVIGPLERQKYSAINEDKFKKLGKEIFKSKDNRTVIYELK